MDIKVAIFDDKIEITSPGKLPPTIDFSDMLSGQSSIRNKVLAPIFKRLGIIEQWGNGLKLIAEELKEYPEIGFDWKEPGMSFRVIFFKLHQEIKSIENRREETDKITRKKTDKITRKKTRKKTGEKTGEKILSQIKSNPKITIRELQSNTGFSRQGIYWNISKLKQEGRIERVGPDKGGYWKVLDKN